MIDTLIDQLVKLRRTYGHIEVDIRADGLYQAIGQNVCIRIDEFGDVLAVIQSAYDKQQRGFNQVDQNDSWLQLKGPNMSDHEAKMKWKAAGMPSRMKPMEAVEDPPDQRPLQAYWVFTSRPSPNGVGEPIRKKTYIESVRTGVELVKEIHDQVDLTPIWQIDNIINLGIVDKKVDNGLDEHRRSDG